jgi:hypothetical protein
MTEVEWGSCTDPQQMLTFLRTKGKTSDRRLRLFACGCCRRIWPLLADPRCREAVEVAERFAEGLGTRKDLDVARASVPPGGGGPWDTDSDRLAGYYAATAAIRCVGRQAIAAASQTASWAAGYVAGRAAEQCDLLRCIFGNPFRPPPAIDRSLLTGHSGTVVRLAESLYEERRWADMPVLADALEEAGCHDPDILGHCRGPGPHARGCWVVDLLLKQG